MCFTIFSGIKTTTKLIENNMENEMTKTLLVLTDVTTDVFLTA